MRLVQISDTHVTHLGGLPSRYLERVVEFVNAAVQPDLIVHTGDLVALDPDEDADRREVRRILSGLTAPVLVLPGNHDVGEPGEEHFMGLDVTSARVRAFRDAWGGDHWVHLEQRWALVGLNSQVFGSGLPEEEEQWTWLHETVQRLDGRSVLLFCHKPLWRPARKPGAPGDGAALSIPPGDCERILGLFGPGQLEAVVTGHLHRPRTMRRGTVLEIWGSTTSMVSAEQGWLVPPIQLCIGEFRLTDEGLEHWDLQIPGLPDTQVRTFWEIPGMQAAMDRLKARVASGLGLWVEGA